MSKNVVSEMKPLSRSVKYSTRFIWCRLHLLHQRTSATEEVGRVAMRIFHPNLLSTTPVFVLLLYNLRFVRNASRAVSG